MKIIEGNKVIYSKNSLNSNRSIEKENNYNTPFQTMRSNLNNQKQILEKKREREAKLNLKINFKYLDNNTNTQNKSSDANERYNINQTSMKVIKSNNSFSICIKLAKL